MNRRVALGAICLLALFVASEAGAVFLSTTSRPSAADQPPDPVCRPNRRVIFDTGGTLFFTTVDEPTAQQQHALDAAVAAWNSYAGSSVRIAVFGFGNDNDDFLAFPDPSGNCPLTGCRQLFSNSSNVIKLDQGNDPQCPLLTPGETLLANPGFQGAWIQHSYCGDAHWSISGSRIRIIEGLAGAALVQTLAHEIGMALGFAEVTDPQIQSVLNRNNPPPVSGTGPYTIALQPYDVEALAAIYPAGWTIGAPATVCGSSAGNVASISNAEPGATYQWTASNGTAITSGQGTSSITFTAPPSTPVFCVTSPCEQTLTLSVSALKSCPGGGPATRMALGTASVVIVAPTHDIAPGFANYSSSAGAGSVQVIAGAGCAQWVASAPAGSFAAITSGASGSGNGTVQYSVAANPTARARTTTLSIAGRSFVITQSAAGKAGIALNAAGAASQVALSWTSTPGAGSYHVFRSSFGPNFDFVTSTAGLSFVDTGVTNGEGYLYRIGAYDGDEYIAYSNVDLAVAYAFTDPALIRTVVPVRAVHLIELREVVNAARAALGWQPVTFGALAAGQTIQRAHLIDLRAKVDAVRAGVPLAPIVYTDPTITLGVTLIQSVHFTELRSALR